MDFVNKLPDNIRIVSNRQEFLAELCKGKNVLHLGCVDSGLTEEAISRDNLLQLKIAKVANMVIGVDSDVKGLKLLDEHKSINERFLQLNVEDLSSDDIEEEIDIIIAGEMLEHLSCPGIFLKNIRKFMLDKNAKMVLTVPNAFRLKSIFGIWDGKEVVHPDHNYYFSYFTIKHFCQKYELGIDQVFTYYVKRKVIKGRTLYQINQYVRNTIIDFSVRRAPFLSDGLIFVIKVL